MDCQRSFCSLFSLFKYQSLTLKRLLPKAIIPCLVISLLSVIPRFKWLCFLKSSLFHVSHTIIPRLFSMYDDLYDITSLADSAYHDRSNVPLGHLGTILLASLAHRGQGGRILNKFL